MKRFLRSESGASLVEFAFLAPVMVFLLIGVVDVGRYMFYATLAANAAHAGASYGAQNTSTLVQTTNIQNAALNDAQNLSGWTAVATKQCSVGGASPSAACPNPPVNTVYYVQVRVTGTFNTLVHYPGLPATFSVGNTTTMRVVNQ